MKHVIWLSLCLSGLTFAKVENCRQYPTLKQFMLAQDVTMTINQNVIIPQGEIKVESMEDKGFKLYVHARYIELYANRRVKSGTAFDVSNRLNYDGYVLATNSMDGNSQLSGIGISSDSESADYWEIMRDNDFATFSCTDREIETYDITGILDDEKMCSEARDA